MKKPVLKILLTIIIFIAVTIFFYFDSKRDAVEYFLTNNHDLNLEVGVIQNLTIFQTRTVSPAININDEFVPGYKIYRYHVKGNKGNAEVRVRLSHGNNEDIIELEKITK